MVKMYHYESLRHCIHRHIHLLANLHLYKIVAKQTDCWFLDVQFIGGREHQHSMIGILEWDNSEELKKGSTSDFCFLIMLMQELNSSI